MPELLTHVGKHPHEKPQAGDVLIDDFARAFHVVSIERVRLTDYFVVHNPGEEPRRVSASEMVPDYRIYRYQHTNCWRW